MENVIIIAVIALIILFAVRYIYREKKSGKKCVGCPYASACAAEKGAYGCSCGGTSDDR